MAITYAQHPGGIEAVSPTQQHLLATQLGGLNGIAQQRAIVLDASEQEGRTLAEIVAFIQGGGVWISWGGYPFYYTPGTPKGSGSNFSRFCQLAAIPDPNASSIGSEFFGPPGGTSRILWTPTASLPHPWMAGQSSQSATMGPFFGQTLGQVTVWPLIGVPVGKGWWFYASTNFAAPTPSTYAAFILRTVPHIRYGTWAVVLGVGAGAFIWVRDHHH